MNEYSITKEEIDTLFTTYQQRQTNEEVHFIQEHHGGIKNLVNKLKSSIDSGIEEQSKPSRIKAFDDNLRKREPMPSFWFFIWEALGDAMLRILIVCAIFQISIGVSPLSENPSKDWIDGIAIVFAIIVIVITTSVTNYNKEKKFKQLNDENIKKFQVVVIRDGKKYNIPDEELVVGDVCKVDLGMIIPADGVMLTSLNLKTDEATLTGESNLMRKETVENCLLREKDFINKKMPSPMVFSGTTVNEGSGLILVLAVGNNSAAGKIREIIKQNKNDDEDSQTPLQIKLEDIANDIGNFGLWAAILTLVALMLKLFWSKYHQLAFKNEQMEKFIQAKFHNGMYVNDTTENISNSTYYLIEQNSIWSGVWKEIISAIILCIAIIVVAIPEGLPLAVTLSLSFSIKKMMDDNNLVRHMHACETMGGANYICTDKTGTLTRNKMHVVTFYNNLDEIDVNMIDSEHQMDSKHKFTNQYFKILRDALINNLDIELYSDGSIISESSSKTDFAFFDFLRGLKQDFNQIYERLDRIQFHSDRKKMSTIVKSNNDGKYYIYMKGAPEVIISACDNYLRPNGDSTNRLSDPDMKKLKEVTGKFSSLTLRNLAVAYKEIDQNQLKDFIEAKNVSSHLNLQIEQKGFTLIGIAAISDALRQGVPQSVALCHSAHVRVIMITGDDEQIARAIAKNAGIISDNEESLVLTGPEFIKKIGGLICKSCHLDGEKCNCPRTVTQAKEILGDDKSKSFLESKLRKEKIKNMDEFKRLIKKLRVIARARAIDKFALVSGLRELDNVVAVTGDGTNDAPALSKADVGFAMGKTGTDVARDAADIIILDDNFNSIVHAIKWGRNIFDNIRKFIQFQLSVNLSAVLLVFVSSCIGSESPITAIQMLWINLIMDSLGSLALATEDPCDELLFRRPYSKREYIISPRMWKHIIAQSSIQFTLVLLLYLFAPKFIPETDPYRLHMISQLENCFGDFLAESSVFKKHQIIHYIMDGKKSSWSPLMHIRRNLDPKVCLFFDTTLFEPKQITTLFEAFKWYTAENGNTCHMTMIFNTFVLYSLFNQINCRILDDSLNIFKRIFSNWMFLAITFIELLCQFAIVQFGGLVFKCSVTGLTMYQWGWCFGMASITFVINFVMKLIPCECIFAINYRRICCCCCKKAQDDEELKQNLMEENEDEISKAEKNIELSLRPINSSNNAFSIDN